MKNPKHTSSKPALRKNGDASPLSHTPAAAAGSHPIGNTPDGRSIAVAEAAADTALSSPVDAIVTAIVGAPVEGIVGNGAGDVINPMEEETYWRGQYNQEAYYEAGRAFDDYAPAYRTGYESEQAGRSFEQAEDELKIHYDGSRGTSTLTWDEARPATRAAWDRMAQSASG